jgi:hypothetical protein
VNFLYVNIGRGHPFYLDGIMEALVRTGGVTIVRGSQDVFEISRGLARLAWSSARWLYRQGPSSSLLGTLYDRVRQGADYNRPGFMLRLMGRGVRARYADDTDPVIVSHPTLVGILAGREDLIYQHGELVAPRESLVTGASLVAVPTEEAAQSFISPGYSSEQILISGLCIEPALVRQSEDSFAARMKRIADGEQLTGAFFSSGAEPASHVQKILAASVSALRAGGRIIIFARKGGRLGKRARSLLGGLSGDFTPLDTSALIPVELPSVTLVEFNSRREEDVLTARLFPAFDYFAAPSHERTNWAMGLGLPMFILDPAFGPFAPLNRALLLGAGVAVRLEDDQSAHSFGAALRSLQREGGLLKMAENGWGRRPIDGFTRIAKFLTQRYA